MSDTAVETGTIRTKIPSRLDRLPWSRFHWLIILGLGTAWILDGLEVTIVGTVASRMTESGSGITISTAQIGTAGAIYVVGACSGALFFGQLTDRFGRKRLFMLTLGLYLIATAATAGAFNAWYFFGARFLTGAGIGGEYAAINSAIDELIPARARGRVDLVINGSYWIGSAAGSAASIALLNTAWLPKDIGWRLGFVIGVILAIAVMLVRRHVPESPRWLFIHGREQEAEEIVARIERGVEEETGERLEPVSRQLTVRQRKSIPFREIAKVGFKVYPKRSILALALFVGQAFIYNGITFNLGTLMTTFFKVSSSFVPVFIILYAVANFAGPLTIGRLFDTVGRKPMISSTYLGSAAIGAVLAWLFAGGALNRWTFIGIVMGTFFLASAGASAAYLTASEIFPMETRALAIAFFYAIGTAVGGISGPLLFGSLISSGVRSQVAIAFYIGSGVMALGGITEIFLGIAAEGQQLESIAKPLTVADAEEQGRAGGPHDEGTPSAGTSERVRQARTRAAEQRANAANHLAAMHLQLAAAREGDEAAADRADEESVLAQVADLMAQADDQEAAAAEEEAAGGTGHEEAAGGAGQVEAAANAGGQRGRAARHRAGAARSRASALRTQAQALTLDSRADVERLRALAEALNERALALEQRAEAELAAARADGDGTRVGAAVRRMNEMRARLHEARAAVSEAKAHGAADPDAQRAAEAALERARAAEAEVSAAEHLRDARREHDEGEAAEAREQEAARECERRRQEQELEDRIRARLQRRVRAERGLRRLRPGPGRADVGSPAISSMAPLPESLESLDHEISVIQRALNERGPLPREEIQRLVGARYWGPGVFSEALAEAVADGAVKRVGRNTYATPDRGD
jgi:MFS family permease